MHLNIYCIFLLKFNVTLLSLSSWRTCGAILSRLLSQIIIKFTYAEESALFNKTEKNNYVKRLKPGLSISSEKKEEKHLRMEGSVIIKA